tara:strand:+ start:25106 stop:25381 length:276 start_codon:yes stop_codon:yes gene_type:complete
MSEHETKFHDPRKYWLDDPKNVKKIIWFVVIACIALFAAEAFYQKHPYFAAESLFGFYAIYGFVACVGLVLVTKVMRVFLMRDEEYYDKNE